MEKRQPATDSLDVQKSTLTSQLTPFIGRQNDLLRVQEMLAEPACRLISLVGGGGVGKTRLCLEIAQRAKSSFADGASFVHLQGVTSPDQAVVSIANSTSCELRGKKDTLTRLKRHLQDKQMLILLDNFEHLLDAVDLIVDLLEAAQQVKIIVTSREVLNLRAEWVWSVTGMQYPDELDAEITDAHSAVHLFNSYAQRLLPEFSLEAEKAHIVRICQLIGGVPLAIELATSWLKSFSCAMIADEIQRNLDFLDTNMRDMPERHRSMRAVIDQSWKQLSEQEQSTFQYLTVFRGGFTSDAADKIVSASRIVLSSLVDKSLLAYAGGRYHVHELLRQYAQQHLETNHEQSEHLLDAHARYYVHFLADRSHTISRDEASLNEILIDLDNLYLAWEQIVAGREYEHLSNAIYCFGHVINSCIGRHEGIKIFAPAIDTYRNDENFPDALPAYIALLTTQSIFYSGLMQVDEAIPLLEACQSLLVKYDFRPEGYSSLDPLVLLGKAHMFKGNFDKALEYGYEAVENAARFDDIANAMIANQLLGMTHLALGQLDEAMQFGQLALSQSKQAENLAISASCTDHLGDTAMLTGNPAVAEHYYHEGYRYRQEINQLMNVPLSMSLIGKAKLAQNKFEEAAEWLENSITLFSTYNDTASLIVPQSQLALCYGYMRDHERARDVFLDAIYAAELTQVVPLWLLLISHIGEFLIQLGNKEKGVTLLTTAIHHPMFNRGRDILIDVQKRLDDIQDTMPENAYHAAHQAGIAADFSVTIHALEHDIKSILFSAAPSNPIAFDDPTDLLAIGLEPLTDREIEVLRLVADGLTNRQIAEHLVVTVGTVKSHTHNIYSKLGVNNRTQGIKLAREHKLI